MAQVEDIITRVPVYVELDRPEERIYAIQALYKQLLNIMDVVKSGGGGGGGATKLSDLTDVSLESLEEGQILKYRSTKWKNEDDDSGTPGPDTVGTEEIKNGAVQIEDMNQNTMAQSGDIDDIFDAQMLGGSGEFNSPVEVEEGN